MRKKPDLQKEKDPRKTRKMKLNKETIKDLDAAEQSAEKVKGGIVVIQTGFTCYKPC